MKIHSTSSRNSLAGFTLVELLVVIAIVATLVAISFAVLGRMRGTAQVANAVTALRQVGIASAGYSAENHGSINVLLYDGHPLKKPGGIRNHFWGRMQPYLSGGSASNNQNEYRSELLSGINSLFNTPNARKMTGTPYAEAPIYGSGPNGIPTPIGFNENLIPRWNGGWMKTATIDDPARTIYCAYGRYHLRPSHGQEYRPLATSNTLGFFYLEDRKAIVCFLDGHVEMMTPPIDERLFGDPRPAP